MIAKFEGGPLPPPPAPGIMVKSESEEVQTGKDNKNLSYDLSCTSLSHSGWVNLAKQKRVRHTSICFRLSPRILYSWFSMWLVGGFAVFLFIASIDGTLLGR